MATSHLITFTFQADTEAAGPIVKGFKSLIGRWKEKQIETRLFQDPKAPGTMMLHCVTEHGVDDLTRLIQEESETRELFQSIRDTGSRVLVVFMEEIV